jgi:hypothetical protein
VDDALWAYVFSAIRRLSSQNDAVQLGVMLNRRKRTGLPANLLGNLLGAVSVRVHPTDEAPQLSAALRSAIRDYASTRVGYHATLSWAAKHARAHERMRYVPATYRFAHGDMNVSSVQNCGLYDLMFGRQSPTLFWGLPSEKPFWWGTAFESPGPTRERSGRVVSLWLPAKLGARLASGEGRALAQLPGMRETSRNPTAARELAWATHW